MTFLVVPLLLLPVATIPLAIINTRMYKAKLAQPKNQVRIDGQFGMSQRSGSLLSPLWTDNLEISRR